MVWFHAFLGLTGLWYGSCLVVFCEQCDLIVLRRRWCMAATFFAVVLAIVVACSFGLSALGIWFIWRHWQHTIKAYKQADAVVSEQRTIVIVGFSMVNALFFLMLVCKIWPFLFLFFFTRRSCKSCYPCDRIGFCPLTQIALSNALLCCAAQTVVQRKVARRQYFVFLHMWITQNLFDNAIRENFFHACFLFISCIFFF